MTETIAILLAVCGLILIMAIIGYIISLLEKRQQALDSKKKVAKIAHDLELADRGCCLYCGDPKDHTYCHQEDGVAGVWKDANTGRCVGCDKRVDHSQCEAIHR